MRRRIVLVETEPDVWQASLPRGMTRVGLQRLLERLAATLFEDIAIQEAIEGSDDDASTDRR